MKISDIKKHEWLTDNPPIKTYVNKIENRIPSKIKTGYHLKLLTPKTMILHGCTKNKTTKKKNGENFPPIMISESLYT